MIYDEQYYGVSLGRLKGNYTGRNPKGEVVATRFPGLDGRLMSKSCAEALARVLKRQFPDAEVTELYRGDRDELMAETLDDLGEKPPVETLTNAVKDCKTFGLTQQDILAIIQEI